MDDGYTSIAASGEVVTAVTIWLSAFVAHFDLFQMNHNIGRLNPAFLL
jgi:hypothetical protein